MEHIARMSFPRYFCFVTSMFFVEVKMGIICQGILSCQEVDQTKIIITIVEAAQLKVSLMLSVVITMISACQ